MEKSLPGVHASRQRNWEIPAGLRIMLVAAVVVIAAAIGHATYRVIQTFHVYVPQITAAAEIRVELNFAHAIHAELLAGDTSAHVSEIVAHLDRARDYAGALRAGGVAPNGQRIFIAENSLLPMAAGVYTHLDKLCSMFALMSDTTAGLMADEKAMRDSLVRYVAVNAEELERLFVLFMQKKTLNFVYIQSTLIILTLVLAGMLALVFRRFERRRVSDMEQITHAKHQLDAANQQLRAANQQLTANEQQLRAANQQLTANEQQLRAANQQLRANEESLREERNRAQSYLDVAGVMIVAIDAAGIVTLINACGAGILGYSAEEIVGENWFSRFVPARMRDDVAGVFADIMKGTIKPVEYFENAVITADGSERLIAWHNALLRRPDGAIAGTLSSGEDVTERRKIEQEMQKTQRLESLGILAGGIAHDFNNLLSGIFGYLDMAREEAKGNLQALSYLDKALVAHQRACGLTRQLLTFSKGGNPQVRPENIDTLLRESSELAVIGSPVRCRYTIPGDLWPVIVDEGQIGQVIGNIVINARQAMPQGGTIEIAARNVTLAEGEIALLKAGRFVELLFTDHGTGIQPEYLKKVFDPFFSTKQTGSGLGLAISHSIVRRHNGHISVDSRLGEGSIFRILLPATDKSEIAEKPAVEVTPAGTGRVLVMDDEEIVRSVTRVMLRSLGYDVVLAKEGAEAVELYRTARESGNPFDVVILDLTVHGGMGGEKAVAELRRIDPRVKAIVTSGYADGEVIADYRSFGFTAALNKPFLKEDLARSIWTVMKQENPGLRE